MTHEADFYKNIIDNLYDGLYFVDRDRKITFWNKGAERITGYKAEQVVGLSCRDNILNHVTANGVQLCLVNCPLAASMEDGVPREAEVFLHHAEGHRVPVVVRASPIRNEGGEIIGAVETFSNNEALFSTRKRMTELNTKVLVDPLTGIGNRRFADARLQSVHFDVKSGNLSAGLLFIDVDHFKEFNDKYGHEVGDRVLRMVAQTLKSNLRITDAPIRWGGEEFIAILSDVPSLHAVKDVAEKMRNLVAYSTLPIPGGHMLSVTVSIGGILFNGFESINDNIKRADQLMYQSKKSGRNCVTVG
jgi:diguanylate cyclase (GGDEF)-like protein/PAS domain S-box-containing protein